MFGNGGQRGGGVIYKIWDSMPKFLVNNLFLC